MQDTFSSAVNNARPPHESIYTSVFDDGQTRPGRINLRVDLSPPFLFSSLSRGGGGKNCRRVHPSFQEIGSRLDIEVKKIGKRFVQSNLIHQTNGVSFLFFFFFLSTRGKKKLRGLDDDKIVIELSLERTEFSEKLRGTQRRSRAGRRRRGIGSKGEL